MARRSRIVLVGCAGVLALASCSGESAPTEEAPVPSSTTTTEAPTTTATEPPPTTTTTTEPPTTTTEPPTTTTTAPLILEPEAAFADADGRVSAIGWALLDGLLPGPDFTLACVEGSEPVLVPDPEFWAGWAPPGGRFEQVRVSAYADESGAQEAFDLRFGWFSSCTADEAVGYARTPIDLTAEGVVAWNVDVLNGDEVIGSTSSALAIEGVTVWVITAGDEPTLAGALEGLRLVP